MRAWVHAPAAPGMNDHAVGTCIVICGATPQEAAMNKNGGLFGAPCSDRGGAWQDCKGGAHTTSVLCRMMLGILYHVD